MAVPTVAMDMEEAKELHPLVEPLTESSQGLRLPRTGLALAAVGIAAASVAALAYTAPWTSGTAVPATRHSFGSGWQQLSEAHARALEAVERLSGAQMRQDEKAEVKDECAVLMESAELECSTDPCLQDCLDIIEKAAACAGQGSAYANRALEHWRHCHEKPPAAPPSLGEQPSNEEMVKCMPALEAFQKACPKPPHGGPPDIDGLCVAGCQSAISSIRSDCKFMTQGSAGDNFKMIQEMCQSGTCSNSMKAFVPGSPARAACNIPSEEVGAYKLAGCDGGCRPALCSIMKTCAKGAVGVPDELLNDMTSDIKVATASCACDA